MNVLVNALFGMKVKGRIAITGTLGYDVSYVRTFSDGRWARDSSDHQSLRHVRRGLVGQPLDRLEPFGAQNHHQRGLEKAFRNVAPCLPVKNPQATCFGIPGTSPTPCNEGK